jgi:hypothetical protein
MNASSWPHSPLPDQPGDSLGASMTCSTITFFVGSRKWSDEHRLTAPRSGSGAISSATSLRQRFCQARRPARALPSLQRTIRPVRIGARWPARPSGTEREGRVFFTDWPCNQCCAIRDIWTRPRLLWAGGSGTPKERCVY